VGENRWERLEDLFAAAVSLTGEERDAFLARQCGEDAALRQELLSLLEAHDRTGVLDTAIQPPAAESWIGPYQLLRQIGEGGMGIVYHARQMQPIRRDVALKVIKPGMDSGQVIARFESERQALAIMDHANIARVFEAGATAAGKPYFVMELVNGVPITQYADARRLSLPERIELFIPVCRALQHAHQKGVIHRDIKPSNILVAEQDGRPVPKVIDFGLAKALGPQVNDRALTAFGAIVGTPEYMSPEQAELTRQDIDTRTDIYSLGAVLYELFTGATPLNSGDAAEDKAPLGYGELLRRIREQEPKAPSTRWRSSGTGEAAALRRSDRARLPKQLHGELDWIVMKAIDKDRSRRYETVNGLARDLERHLAGEPVEAGPPSATYRARKLLRKYRLAISVSAAGLLLLVAAVVVSSSLAVRASRAEQVARAVNSFLEDDLLGQASASRQARPNTKPDPDLKVRTALDRAAALIEQRFPAQPLVEASLRQTIARAYTDLGLYPEAQRQVERALELRRRSAGEKAPDTLTSMNMLAELNSRQARYAEAEQLYRRTLELRRQELGAEHPDTLTTMNGLAVVYIYQGKLAEAAQLLDKLLEIRQRVLGPEHPDTLSTMNNLAMVHLNRDEFSSAQGLFAKVLEVRRRVLGAEHPLTLISMNNLATAYIDESKYADAQPLYEAAYAIERRVSGADHPDTLTLLANLGQVYEGEGAYTRAEEAYRNALEAQARVLGEAHTDTLMSMQYLGGIYFREGKYAAAEAMLAKALPLRQRVLGVEHADTLRTEVLLGHTLVASRKYGDARPLLDHAVAAYARSTPDTRERWEAAAVLGMCLTGQGRYADAERLLVDGYRQLARLPESASVSGELSPQQLKRSIHQLYEKWGKPEKAAEWQ
jgi:eukaryotic-like serine/threonine-protein kinase